MRVTDRDVGTLLEKIGRPMRRFEIMHVDVSTQEVVLYDRTRGITFTPIDLSTFQRIRNDAM